MNDEPATPRIRPGIETPSASQPPLVHVRGRRGGRITGVVGPVSRRGYEYLVVEVFWIRNVCLAKMILELLVFC